MHEPSPGGRHGVKAHPKSADYCEIVVTDWRAAFLASAGWLSYRPRAWALGKVCIRAGTTGQADSGLSDGCSWRD